MPLPFLAIGLATAASWAQSSPSADPAPDIPYEKYELPNGLDVILSPDHNTPIVQTNVWYHVGSYVEPAGSTGFAHLFEHLMFQGSISQPNDYFTILQSVGADLNGSTSFDRTNYFETVPSQYLPLALYMESDRMGWLLDVLDQTKLDNQRDVVRNERRQRYENPPYGEVMIHLYSALFPDGHPYHHMPIGSHEDLEKASLDEVKTFFRTWYTPDNASLTICGDFDPAVAKQLVEKYFAGVPKGTIERKPPTEVHAELRESKELREYDNVPEQKVWIAWISPKAYAPGDADLDLLSSVLTDGKDSRLYHKLVKELQIAKDVSAYQGSMSLQSAYIIQATAAPGHTTDECVKAIDDVLADTLGAHPPTDEEIEGARNGYEVAFYEGIATVGGKADLLNHYNIMLGDPGYLQKDLARYRAATAASVVQWGKDVLTKPRVVLHVWPEKDKPADAPTGSGGGSAPSPVPSPAQQEGK